MDKRFLVVAGSAGSFIGFRKPLLLALKEKGLDVHVVAPNLLANAKVMTALKEVGIVAHEVPMQRTGMNPLRDLQSLFALFGLMKKIKPDYVLGYTIKPVIYGSIAARLAGVPQRFALITGLGYAFISADGRGLVRTIAQSLYRFAIKGVHVIFFQNPDDRDFFQQQAITAPNSNQVVVNGSGVDIDEYPATPLPDGEPRFLLIARLLGDKGVREYVAAAKLVKEKHPNIQFDLVGDLDANPNSISKQELEGWVEKGLVNYLGYLDDVRTAIKQSSVFVLPSYREGTPRSVLEAMSMARAIITTDAPGCRETVQEGLNGFLVPIKNSEVLAERMLKLIQDPELLRQMGTASREIAVEKYDVRKVNAQMLQAMQISAT